MTPAEVYERFLVPAVFRPWAEAVLAAHPPAPGARVLDVACGTGIGARLAASRVGRAGRVVGLDFDPSMLAVARTVEVPAGAAPIAWQPGSALAMPFTDETFDYVLCLEGIQFFPEREAGLREMRRVLRRGGRLVASVWGPLEANPAYEAVAAGLGRFVSAEAARLAPFGLTDRPAVAALVRAAGFADVTVSVERLDLSVPSAEALVDWLAGGGPTIRRSLAHLTGDRRPEFDRFVAARLAPHRGGGGLTLPSTRHVVVAG